MNSTQIKITSLRHWHLKVPGKQDTTGKVRINTKILESATLVTLKSNALKKVV